ncbi:MAG: hypothetical protein O2973_10940 [Gemmatimonadetes bacterium]|nr:hypothetical protein [Gemmatimonadota bacterium]
MTRSTRLTAALLMIAFVAPAASAQQGARSENSTVAPVAPARAVNGSSAGYVAERAAPAGHTASSAPVSGPRVTRATAGVRVNREATAFAALPAPRREETRQNRAMMIVGGAALIVGAIIGDTVGTLVMVAGAGVGLYGLYKYLE